MAKTKKLPNPESTDIEEKAKRDYKDTLFRYIFKGEDDRSKRWLLSLYNALNDSNYTDINDLKITTIQNALFLTMKDDLSFLNDDELNLFEHQSTPNPNLPLRYLYYVSDLYHRDHIEDDIYSSRRLKIKTPNFIVLYNGTQIQDEIFEYNLADMFEQKTENPTLNLKVMVYNINRGKNEAIKNACQTLKEYMRFVDSVRDNLAEGEGLKSAVNKAIKDCVEKNVLKEFLLENREAVMHSCLYEYDEEKHIKNEKNISYEEGVEHGREEKVKEIITGMLGKKYRVEDIAEITKTSLDYVNAIAESLTVKS